VLIGANANGTVVFEHNTYDVGIGESGFAVGETYNGNANEVTSMQNNLAWSLNANGSLVQYEGNVSDSNLTNGVIVTADYNGHPSTVHGYWSPPDGRALKS